MASEKVHRVANYVLLICIPIMIAITILVGAPESYQLFGMTMPTPDYPIYYVQDWIALFSGQNPYHYICGAGGYCSCYYPPGFLSLVGFIFFYAFDLLGPKIFLCLIWIFTAYKVNALCKKYAIPLKATIYLVFVIILFNPFYLASLLITGTYDVLIGLFVLLAVIAIDENEQIRSGIYAALALLFKFIGLAIIAPLVFIKKKINWKTGLIFVLICGGVYFIGFLLWGSYVLNSFTLHLARSEIITSIAGVLGISLNTLLLLLLAGGGIVLAIIGYFLYSKNTDPASFTLIFILVFLMLFALVVRWVPVAAMVWFLPLFIYWSVTHDYKLNKTIGLYQVAGIPIMIFWGFFGVELSNNLGAWIGQIIYACLNGVVALSIYLNRDQGEK